MVKKITEFYLTVLFEFESRLIAGKILNFRVI